MRDKKIFKLSVLVVVLIFILAIVIIFKQDEENYDVGDYDVEDMGDVEIFNIINNNSKLPIRYMSKYKSDEAILQKYQKIDNYMSKDFEDTDISFSYYGYPNDESDYYLGIIELLTNRYNILGVSIGDNVEQAISKIQKYGFESEKMNRYFLITLKYKDFTIEIKTDIEDENIIDMIQLCAESEYLGNNVY